MKKLMVIILIILITLCGCTANSSKDSLNAKESNIDGVSTIPSNMKIDAIIYTVSDNGKPFTLVTADGLDFERIRLLENNITLDFVPEFGQSVNVEISDIKVESLGFVTANLVNITKIEDKMKAQYIRGVNDDKTRKKAITINSEKELLDYYNKIIETFPSDDLYLFDEFRNAISEFSNEYFENNFLVVVELFEGSGSYRHIVKNIEGDTINIRHLSAGTVTLDTASWRIIVELDREKHENMNYEVNVISNKYSG